MNQHNISLPPIINPNLSNINLFDYQVIYKAHENSPLIEVFIIPQETHKKIILGLCQHTHRLYKFDRKPNLQLSLHSLDLYDCAIVDLWLKAIDFLYVYARTYHINQIVLDAENIGLTQTLQLLNHLDNYDVEREEYTIDTNADSYAQFVENYNLVIQEMKTILWRAQHDDFNARRFLQTGKLPLLNTVPCATQFNSPAKEANIISLAAIRQPKEQEQYEGD